MIEEMTNKIKLARSFVLDSDVCEEGEELIFELSNDNKEGGFSFYVEGGSYKLSRARFTEIVNALRDLEEDFVKLEQEALSMGYHKQ